MIARLIKHSLATLLLLCPAVCFAQQSDAWLEVAASYYNPDWEFRESENGVRLSAYFQKNTWFATATYNTTDTAFVNESVVRLRGLPFGNWRELSAGYIFDFGSQSTLYSELTYHGLTIGNRSETGYAMGLGAKHTFAKRYSAGLRVSRLYDLEKDWRLTGELLTGLSKRMELVLRIDDFAEFDFTWYEVGLRYHW